MITLILLDVQKDFEFVLEPHLNTLGFQRCSGLAMQYQSPADYVDWETVDIVLGLYTQHGTSFGYLGFVVDYTTGEADAVAKYFNSEGDPMTELTLMTEIESVIQDHSV